MNTWTWCLIVGYPLSWWLILWVAKRGTMQIAAMRIVALEQAQQTAAAEHEAERERLHAELKLVISDLHSERDKVSRYFAKISEFEKQRDEWLNLYHQQSIGHGNAQSLMMSTIEQLARKLQQHGIAVKIPRVLQEVRQEFLETHEAPSRAVLNAPQEAAVAVAVMGTGVPVVAD